MKIKMYSLNRANSDKSMTLCLVLNVMLVLLLAPVTFSIVTGPKTDTEVITDDDFKTSPAPSLRQKLTTSAPVIQSQSQSQSQTQSQNTNQNSGSSQSQSQSQTQNSNDNLKPEERSIDSAPYDPTSDVMSPSNRRRETTVQQKLRNQKRNNSNNKPESDVPKVEDRLLISISDEDRDGPSSLSSRPSSYGGESASNRRPAITIAIQDVSNSGNDNKQLQTSSSSSMPAILIQAIPSQNSHKQQRPPSSNYDNSPSSRPTSGLTVPSLGASLISGLFGSLANANNLRPSANDPNRSPPAQHRPPIDEMIDSDYPRPPHSSSYGGQPIGSPGPGGHHPPGPGGHHPPGPGGHHPPGPGGHHPPPPHHRPPQHHNDRPPYINDERPYEPLNERPVHNNNINNNNNNNHYLDQPSTSSPSHSNNYERPVQSSGSGSSNRPTTSSDGPRLNEPTCGVIYETKIVGGEEADPDDYMWMAAMIKAKSSTPLSEARPFCGGSLITNRHVLTAAHCLVDLAPRDVLIRLGSYDFDDSATSSSGDYAVDQFRVPAEYNKKTHVGDIAIMRLKQPLTSSENFKTICMPQLRRSYVDTLATVIGYGTQSQSFRKASPKLRQVTVPVWDNEKCGLVYKKNLTDSFMCAGYEEGGKDACQGDSGGPLMAEGPTQRMMIIGVVSHGIGCGSPGYPGVYTRVSNYLDWIEKNTRE